MSWIIRHRWEIQPQGKFWTVIRYTDDQPLPVGSYEKLSHAYAQIEYDRQMCLSAVRTIEERAVELGH